MDGQRWSLSDVMDLGSVELQTSGALKRAGLYTLIEEIGLAGALRRAGIVVPTTWVITDPPHQHSYRHCDVRILPNTFGILFDCTRFKLERSVVVRPPSGELWCIRSAMSISHKWDSYNPNTLQNGYLAKLGHVLEEQGESVDVTTNRYIVFTENGALIDDDEWEISDSPPAVWIDDGRPAPKTVPLGNRWVQFAEGSVGKRWISEEWNQEALYITLPSGAKVMLVEMSLIHGVKQYTFFYRDPWIDAWNKLNA